MTQTLFEDISDQYKNLDKYKKSFTKLFEVAKEIHEMPKTLGGDVTRSLLNVINKYSKIETVQNFPTSTQICSWEAPRGWSLLDYELRAKDGPRLIPENEPLAIVGYSKSIDVEVSGKELIKHVFTHSKIPSSRPYKTSYFREDWGFCLTASEAKMINPKQVYKVKIDAQFDETGIDIGITEIGNYKSEEIILIIAHTCFPSMFSFGTSGILASMLLQQMVQKIDLNKRYIFLLSPETFGILAFLQSHYSVLKNRDVEAFILTGLDGYGDQLNITNIMGKASRNLEAYLMDVGIKYHVRPWTEMGSDDFQLNHPNVKIPCAIISNGYYNKYPYYHSSADTLTMDKFLETLRYTFFIYDWILRFDEEKYFRACHFAEPQYNNYGLASTNAKNTNDFSFNQFRLIVQTCDGNTSISEIAHNLGIKRDAVEKAIVSASDMGIIK